MTALHTRLSALRTEAAVANREMQELGYPAPVSAEDRRALREEQMRALWDAYEADAESDPYFQGGWA